MAEEKDSIINCHTHVFTGDHVPPYLARTFVPEPFHFLISLKVLVSIFRWWYRWPARIPHKFWFKWLRKGFTHVNLIYNKCWPFNTVLEYYLFFQTFYILNKLLPPVLPAGNWLSKLTDKFSVWLSPYMLPIDSPFLQVCFVIFVLLFFPTIRNLLAWMSSGLKKFLAMLPGKQTREMIGRYLNIGRYAFHRHQSTIFSKLKSQYPADTGFVVLPMDMDYMGAGKSRTRYRDQMEELAELKNDNKETLFPFVFVDPRRCVPLRKEKRFKKGDKPFFVWKQVGVKVILEDCFIRDYLEDKQFNGIKIYPALGYFPFDIRLLPLWKYAADNGIPILTHCIKGTIFYRGRKQAAWYQHPVFEQAMSKQKNGKNGKNESDGFETDEEREAKDSLKEDYVPLDLPQTKNVDFSTNFTHPMNYLCLLDKTLLHKVISVEAAKDTANQKELDRVKTLFGYTSTGLTRDLSKLKLCLGHFGGDDEWCRYFEKDRYNYSSQLTKHPDRGIEFLKRRDGRLAPGKPEQLWRYTDWYSIICSMMLQYDNVYADISYILHNDTGVLPLLKETLQNKGLREKVLYGTDFFVVRNHKSDKNMLADMMGGLSVEDFDQVARVNPRKYLNLNMPDHAQTTSTTVKPEQRSEAENGQGGERDQQKDLADSGARF